MGLAASEALSLSAYDTEWVFPVRDFDATPLQEFERSVKAIGIL